MPETHTVEISIKQVITVVVVLILIGIVVAAFVTRDTWLPAFQREAAETEEATVSITATSEDPVAILAEQVATAFHTIDYRDQEGYIKQLEPLSTDMAIEMLRTVLVPMSFSLYEKDQLIIKEEQITAEDQGILKQGDMWQIRLVNVHIDDPPERMQSSDIEVRLLIVMLEDGTWKFQALLTEEEVDQFEEGEEMS